MKKTKDIKYICNRVMFCTYGSVGSWRCHHSTPHEIENGCALPQGDRCIYNALQNREKCIRVGK